MCAHAQALVDSVVFAIDGEDGHVAPAGGGGKDFTRGDHAFLVGQADGLAGENCGVGGFKAGDANDGGDDEVRLGQGGAGDGAGGAVYDFDAGDAGLFEAFVEVGCKFFGGQGDDCGAPANGLRKGMVDVAPGGERGNREAVGKLLNDGEGALPDGAGGTEDGESFQRVCKPKYCNKKGVEGPLEKFRSSTNATPSFLSG
jgi:hypothetical protein